MPKWAILVMGLIPLALGIVLVVQSNQWIIGIVVLVISVLVIILGIKQLGIKRKPKKETPVEAEATPETQNKPPAS
jgi:membrane protein implicated in regulation of membrane protease activity